MIATAVTPILIAPQAPEDSGFDRWRDAARDLLLAGTSPDLVDFHDVHSAPAPSLDLTPSTPPSAQTGPQSGKAPHVPRPFLKEAFLAAHHRSPHRWNLLYRLLWKLQSDRNLLHIEVDPWVAEFKSLARQVGHDLHKMHAFVRFRKIQDREGEHFIAWHKPAHRILDLAVPFFAERFSVMRWSILTPDNSVSWDPATRSATFGPGADRSQAPSGDELEDLWQTYYSSIFNPARLNPSAMRSHMPVKYWSSLPEVDLLPTLITRAGSRVASMVSTQRATPTAQPFVPSGATLPMLRQALPACQGCSLFQHATQAVAGRGPGTATLMLVGEQPGDKEDLAGEPFVGLAGEVLRRALHELGISSSDLYMTNAVKHFKFVQRGKLRIHKNPAQSEVNACRPWLEAEIQALRPRVILCMGATSARALLGATFALMRDHGRVISTRYCDQIIATVHPSAILRTTDKDKAKDLYEIMKSDLLVAWSHSQQSAPPLVKAFIPLTN
jgi:probable DNA metabolism protein